MRHVREWVANYKTTGWFEYDDGVFVYGDCQNEKNWPGQEVAPLSPLTILSARTGIEVSTLQKWLKGTRNTISFEHADALIVAMDADLLWHTDDTLCILYHAVAA